MYEPTLNYVTCSDAHGPRRMAYWEWDVPACRDRSQVLVCVHGLTRQGRDFDALARALSPWMRVVCPDIAGRGYSDWLRDPSQYALPQYAADVHTLLTQLHARSPITRLDWLGTSMGGLIGLVMAGTPGATPVPLRALLLNDVAPALQWDGLARIGEYVGRQMDYPDSDTAVQALRELSAGFGPHTPAQWRALSLPMLRPMAGGGCRLHYDPAIGANFAQLTPEQAEHGEALLWRLYDQITAQVLLVRGAQSDLVSAATAAQMQQRGPRARCTVVEAVGHAPTLVDAKQIALVKDFFVGDQ